MAPTYRPQAGDKHGLDSSSIPDARRWINAVAIFEKKKLRQTEFPNFKRVRTVQ